MNYKWAVDQLEQILGRLTIIDTAQSRILARVDDPYETIDMIMEFLPDDTPILRIIPVDEVLEPYVEDVAEHAWSLADEKIPSNNTYRVTIEGGHLYWRKNSQWAHTIDAIKYIASKIDRKVDLENYDWIVYVRVLRVRYTEYAALTVAPAKYIFSKAKQKKRANT